MPRRTLLAVLAHPDDEVGVAGTLLAQRARGDRVVVVWLTRGEMTEALGPLPVEEVARRRTALGAEAARILDVEHRFLDFPDTAVEAGPEAARTVARVVADVRPDGVLTWGEGWVSGQRHPDHRATGRIARDAVTLARIAKIVEPASPHRAFAPVFTLRGSHSTLPWAAVDVAPHLDGILELADHYRAALGFGDRDWVTGRLRRGGELAGVEYAEVFDAWESRPGLSEALLPADRGQAPSHPDPRAASAG
ncbi:MAG TPA: PIG-L deacetylase family protein [Longimicrobiales bacterium]|nr:PIG-L deacetylase family protein [Longimicrobiales bacterium]